MLLGCDTMVALPSSTKYGQTLFAKNSDRPTEECQPLVQRPNTSHASGTVVRCQFIDLPQVPTTYAHVGSRPYWCWGYEHGFNEHQVVIGNEGLSSKWPEADEPKLIGMEILRLGLERGRTAAEAVDVMTGLVGEYGQGRFANAASVRTYDNGYIVADPSEAYIIDTAGHEWAVKRVERSEGISNEHSVKKDWLSTSSSVERSAMAQGWWVPDEGRLDFTRTFCDFQAGEGGLGAARRARSTSLLDVHDGRIDVRTMIALLRDHSDCMDPGEDFVGTFPNGRSLCMHHGDQVKGNTAASLIADLCGDGSRVPVYWCSMYSPCLGPFLPIFASGEVPSQLALGGEDPDLDSPWWLFRELERWVRTDGVLDEDKAVGVRTEWTDFQEKLLISTYEVATEAKGLQHDGQPEQAEELLSGHSRAVSATAIMTARRMVGQDSSTR